MTTTDWIVDIALVLVVLRQVREGDFTWRSLLLPLGLVSWSAATYLRSVPTAGHDLVLVGLAVAAGGALGATSGLATRVRGAAGRVLVKAGPVAAGLWILGAGSRLAFQLYATHGGAPHIAAFSAAHQITSQQAWVAALLLMALTEVVVRLSIVAARAVRLGGRGALAAAPRTPVAA